MPLWAIQDYYNTERVVTHCQKHIRKMSKIVWWPGATPFRLVQTNTDYHKHWLFTARQRHHKAREAWSAKGIDGEPGIVHVQVITENSNTHLNAASSTDGVAAREGDGAQIRGTWLWRVCSKALATDTACENFWVFKSNVHGVQCESSPSAVQLEDGTC